MPEAPGLGYTLGVGLRSPEDFWKRLKGYGTGALGLIQGLGGAALNLGQAAINLSPPMLGMNALQVPGAPFKYTKDPTSPMAVPERIAALGDALTLGIPSALSQRYGEIQSQDTQPQNVENSTVNLIKAVGTTAAKDIFPFGDIYDWARGDKKTGYNRVEGEDIRQQMTPEELSEKELHILMKSLPLAGVLGKTLTGPKSLGSAVKKTTTVGEMAALQGLTGEELIQGIKDTGKIPRAKPGFGVKNAEAKADAILEPGGTKPLELKDALPEDIASRFQVQEFLASPEALPVIREVYNTEVFRKMVQTSEKGEKVTQTLGRAIEANALSSDTNVYLAQKFGLEPPEVANTISNVLLKTAKESGTVLGALSEAKQFATMSAKLMYDILQTPQALKDFRSLTKTFSGMEPTTVWQKAQQAIRFEESFRRALMVSSLKTLTRNIAQQGIQTWFIDAMEEGLAGMFQKFGSIKEGTSTYGSPYRDALNNWSMSVSNVAAGPVGKLFSKESQTMANRRLNALEEGLRNQPLLKMDLLGESMFETGNQVLGNIRKGVLPEGLKEWGQAYTDLSTIGLHMQEMYYRRLLYGSRLETNLRSMGWKDLKEPNGQIGKTVLEQFNDLTLADEMPLKIKEASADALIHSLKSTYAYTPEAGPGAAILKIYKHAPILTAIGPSFPRFMINKFIWLSERAPTNWFKIFNPEFRKALQTSVEEGGLTSRFAARELAKATTGGMMFAGMMALEEDEKMQGPKYYLVPTGTTTKENGVEKREFLDIRPYDPLVTLKAFAHIGRLMKNGQEPNLTSDEWFDLAAGVRRAQDLVIFDFMNEVREAAMNENGIATGVFQAAVKKAGMHFASFMAQPRMIQDLKNAATSQPTVYRDIKDQPLTGGVGAALNPSVYEPRINPFTGTPEQEASPGWSQSTGVSYKRSTKLEELVRGLPKMNLGDLTGRHKTSTAENLVAKHLGQMVNEKLDGERAIGDVLVDEIKDLPPVLQREVVIEFFKELRGTTNSPGALQKAMEEDASKHPDGIPINFIEDEVKKASPAERDELRKLLREIELKYPR